MLNELMNSPYAWAFLAIVTIASLIYAIVCQHTNKERKEFAYVKNTNILIENKKRIFDKLNIMYGSEQINDLSVTKFIIWNNGNRVLNKDDIVSENELSIYVTDNNKILDYMILEKTEDTNKFEILSLDSKRINIFFDYVNVNDGVVVQVIHTGSNLDIHIDVKIKGGKSIKEIINKRRFFLDNIDKKIRRRWLKILSLFMFFAFISILVVLIVPILAVHGIIGNETIKTSITNENNIVIFTYHIMFIIYLIMTIFHIKLLIKLFGIGIPEKLKKHIL